MSYRELPARYRYYKMPPDSHVLALFAVEWLHLQKHGDAPHFHNLLEIGYCLEGRGELFYGSVASPYGSGTMTVAPANYPHSTIADPTVKNLWEYLLIDVDDFLKNVYPDGSDIPWRLSTRINTGPLHLTEQQNSPIRRLMVEILDVSRERGDLFHETQRGLTLALLVEVARAHKNPLEARADDDAFTTVLHSALDYISEHYTQKISVKELADACYLSESHFRRVFEQYMHMTPVTYINHVRIQAACRMLTATGEPVVDVARRCGFISLSTFNRTFRRLVGGSPRQWRVSLPKSGSHDALNEWSTYAI